MYHLTIIENLVLNKQNIECVIIEPYIAAEKKVRVSRIRMMLNFLSLQDLSL
jgi:hypothetical protein